ncbi:unnamed protein product, partial [Rotaria sordida]
SSDRRNEQSSDPSNKQPSDRRNKQSSDPSNE